MCKKNMAERVREPWGFKSFSDCTDYHSPNVYESGKNIFDSLSSKFKDIRKLLNHDEVI